MLYKLKPAKYLNEDTIFEKSTDLICSLPTLCSMHCILLGNTNCLYFLRFNYYVVCFPIGPCPPIKQATIYACVSQELFSHTHFGTHMNSGQCDWCLLRSASKYVANILVQDVILHFPW